MRRATALDLAFAAIVIFLIIVISGSLGGCGGGGGGSSMPPVAAAAPAPIEHVPAALPAEKAPEPAKKVWPACSIALYGDSIMTGTYVSERPAARITRLRPGWLVYDRAIAGETAEAGIARVVGDTDVTVLEWGVNDVTLLNKSPVEPLRKVLKELKNRRVLTGMPNVRPQADGVNAALLQLAIDSGAAFSSWGETAVVTLDGTHPDQASSDALVDDLINTLDKECPQ